MKMTVVLVDIQRKYSICRRFTFGQFNGAYKILCETSLREVPLLLPLFFCCMEGKYPPSPLPLSAWPSSIRPRRQAATERGGRKNPLLLPPFLSRPPPSLPPRYIDTAAFAPHPIHPGRPTRAARHAVQNTERGGGSVVWRA